MTMLAALLLCALPDVTVAYGAGLTVPEFVKLVADGLGEPIQLDAAVARSQVRLRGETVEVPRARLRSFFTAKLAEVDLVAVPLGPFAVVRRLEDVPDLLDFAPSVSLDDLRAEAPGTELCRIVARLETPWKFSVDTRLRDRARDDPPVILRQITFERGSAGIVSVGRLDQVQRIAEWIVEIDPDATFAASSLPVLERPDTGKDPLITLPFGEVPGTKWSDVFRLGRELVGRPFNPDALPPTDAPVELVGPRSVPSSGLPAVIESALFGAGILIDGPIDDEEQPHVVTIEDFETNDVLRHRDYSRPTVPELDVLVGRWYPVQLSREDMVEIACRPGPLAPVPTCMGPVRYCGPAHRVRLDVCRATITVAARRDEKDGR